ncbi:amino acid transporter [Scopulibacillus darangshiensis]|uniref:Amino acid transporter n=1 Tax=Scopulibacillus darangshiensis TaxID=442528 RepID=A0A4R2NR06_9BACL|nr:APC family permease [Scopulibacillus darangshiensis]TCP23818.1 amino acid transporter [Scopulibacillus darangshiensis]
MSQGKFKRKLNLLDLTFLGVGSIIGSGWLYASLKGASYAGPMAWLSWLIGAFAIILIGLVYAELGASLPRAGGFVRYPDYSHGSIAGYLIGFASLLAYSSVIGVEVEAVRGYAQTWWTALGHADGSPTILGFIVQIALLFIFFLLNYWSVNIFGKVNTLVTVFKFVVPAITIIVLLSVMHSGNFSVTTAEPGGMHGVFKAVAGAGIVFAFLGFRQAIDFAGEAKRPQKDVPLSIILSVVIGLVVYVLLQIAFIGSVPPDQLINGWANLDFQSPYADLAAALGMIWLVNLILFDAVISPAGTGNIYLSGTARVLFAWAKNGYFYSIFQKVDPKTGVPRAALWLTFILAALWTLPSQFQVWGGLISAVTSAFVLTYMAGPVTAGAFRKTLPDLERPFRLKAMAVISPLAFIAATLIAYWSGWSVNSLIIGLTLGSLVLYFAFIDRDEKFTKNLKKDFRSSIWIFAYYIMVLVMSGIGTFGGKAIIPAPWDTILVAVLALGIYYWGVNTGLKEPRITEDEEYEEVEGTNSNVI